MKKTARQKSGNTTLPAGRHNARCSMSDRRLVGAPSPACLHALPLGFLHSYVPLAEPRSLGSM
jgi:hypothetical protein